MTAVGIEMKMTRTMSTRVPEKVSFAASDKICSHEGHLKVSRGEVSLVKLLVKLVRLAF